MKSIMITVKVPAMNHKFDFNIPNDIYLDELYYYICSMIKEKTADVICLEDMILYVEEANAILDNNFFTEHNGFKNGEQLILI